MNNNALIEQVKDIAKPIADELGYEIYHVEYVKENGEFYLRIYIDKPDGILLSDCENLSRRVNEILDQVDPIKEQYYFEVSSPGLNRRLFTDDHFHKYVGKQVLIKTKSAIEGSKTLNGILENVDDENILIKCDEKIITVPKAKIKTANLDGEI